MEFQTLKKIYEKLTPFFEEQRLNQTLFMFIHSIGIASALIFIPIYYGQHYYNLMTSNILVSLFLITNTAWCYFSRNYSVHYHLSAFACMLHLYYTVVSTGGLASPLLFWPLLLAVSSTFWGGLLGVAVWLIISCLPIILLYNFNDLLMNIVPQTVFSQEQFLFLTLMSYLLITTLLVLWTMLFVRNMRTSFETRDKAQEQLSELIRMLTHDISNPLLVLKSVLTLCKKDENDNYIVSKNYYEMMSTSLTAMEKLIVGVRELNALESGSRKLHLECVNLKVILDETLLFFQAALDAKKIRVSIAESGHDSFAHVDKSVLSLQVLSNVISNAIKYSHIGGEISVSFKNYSSHEVEIIIRDQGIGIPSSLLVHLFSYNKKAFRVGTAGEKGVGFGMPLTEALVKQMQGEIKVLTQSQSINPHEHGTEVRIYLPRFKE